MPSRGKHHKHPAHPGGQRFNLLLFGVGMVILLALVVTLIWLISSPRFVKPQ